MRKLVSLCHADTPHAHSSLLLDRNLFLQEAQEEAVFALQHHIVALIGNSHQYKAVAFGELCGRDRPL